LPKLSRYVIGIDLGTTNSALAYVDRRSGRGATVIRTFEVPQLVAPGEVRARPLLPSCVYIPGEHELPASATALPFGERQGFVVGEFARLQGGRVPGRLVASSKSWLCYGRVDRRAPILPWDAPPDVPRISPIEAAARLLAHFRDAWDSLIGQGEPEKAFLAQEVIVTVPASFDAVARQLTLEAAREAGIEHALLIEEPQAALYAFIAASGGRLEERLPAGSVVLVIDVGGGTTDLTLVSVRAATPDDAEERLVFERTAVSDHLLLGGDNMDLALARYLAPRLEGGDGEPELGPSEWGMLRHACREAKESLLAEQAPERTRITLPGSGTRLVGGARSAELTRADVLTLVLEGFFPKVDLEDTTPRRSRAGLHELGLPFVADPAVTRHLGAFLRQHAPRGPEGAGGGAPVARPTAVLFNGAVMTNRLVRERVVDTIEGWTGLRPIELPAGSAPPGARIPRAARQSGGDASPPAARGSPEGSAPFSGRKPGSAAARSAPPPPEPPPGELRVLVLVERRDAWVDDRVDEAALEVALSEGVLITPFVYTAEEFGSPLSAATPLGAEAARGEEF